MSETSPNSRRPKYGGRKKGTPNKSTAAIRDAVFDAFAALQAECGGDHGHLLDWARDHPTDFYRLAARLMPRPIVVAEACEPITEIRRTIVYPDGHVRLLAAGGRPQLAGAAEGRGEGAE